MELHHRSGPTAAVLVATATMALTTTACGGGGKPASTVADHAATPGGVLAFMRPGKVGEYDIWSVRPDGAHLRRMTQSPEARSDYNPAWSPDGRWLLFERRKLDETAPGGDEALYKVGARGGAIQQVTHCHGACWSDSEGAWSSSGRRIAFGRATGPRSAPGPSLVAIYVANADGTHVSRISKPPHGYEDHYPTWSPHGRTIVFQRNTSDSSGAPVDSRLVRVTVATRAERTLYRFPRWAQGAGQPDFSPNGHRILFSYWCIYGDSCPRSTRASRNATLATIRPDSTGLHRLRLRTGADSGAFSPDGERVVFRCRSKPGTPPPPGLPPLAGVFRVCVSNLDGTALKRFRWPVSSAEPDWGARRP